MSSLTVQITDFLKWLPEMDELKAGMGMILTPGLFQVDQKIKGIKVKNLTQVQYFLL